MTLFGALRVAGVVCVVSVLGFPASASEPIDVTDWENLDAETQGILAEIINSASVIPEVQESPADQSIQSLERLQREIRRGERRHLDGFVQASPEALVLCRPTILNLCLNGRFLVTAVWDSPYDAAGIFPTGAIQLTPQSGVLFFQDPTNFEVVIKVLNSNCLSFPNRPWVFAAGLTNFGVSFLVKDMLSGAERTYVNSLSNPFPPLIDQNTPFACF